MSALPPATLGEQVRSLQAQARELAGAHVETLLRTMNELGEIADAIAAGGEVYPAGIRDQVRRLSDDLDTRGRTVAALMERCR